MKTAILLTIAISAAALPRLAIAETIYYCPALRGYGVRINSVSDLPKEVTALTPCTAIDNPMPLGHSNKPNGITAPQNVGASKGADISPPSVTKQPLVKQRLIRVDPCAGINPTDAADLDSCAQNAIWDQNYVVARKWAQRGAEAGSHLAAFWLAGLYEDGSGGPKDLIAAYAWYNIAATLHAIEIENEPPATNDIGREDNRQDINYRDDVGKKLKPEEINQALRFVKKWLAQHSRQ